MTFFVGKSKINNICYAIRKFLPYPLRHSVLAKVYGKRLLLSRWTKHPCTVACQPPVRDTYAPSNTSKITPVDKGFSSLTTSLGKKFTHISRSYPIVLLREHALECCGVGAASAVPTCTSPRTRREIRMALFEAIQRCGKS